MDTNFGDGGGLRYILEEAVRQEGSRDERSTLNDLQHELSTSGVSKKRRPVMARAAWRYLEEQYGREENARLDMYFYGFLASTRLAIHSVHLRQAMISWLDEYFEGKRVARRDAAVTLFVLIVVEAEAKRLQYYSIHKAPGSAELKSRKRIVPYRVHSWALEAAKRWLPQVRKHFTDQVLWSLLRYLFRVLPEDVYSEAEYLADFQRLSSDHPEWSSQERAWTLHILRPEPDWLYRIGRLSEAGRDTMKSFFVPLTEKAA